MKNNMLTDWMLKEHGEYVVKVKACLLKAIITLCLRYPQPTEQNCNKPNTHFILDLEKRFFGHYTCPQRIELYRALFRLWADEYEHDDSHAKNFDYLLGELHQAILERKYKLYPPDQFTVYWKE